MYRFIRGGDVPNILGIPIGLNSGLGSYIRFGRILRPDHIRIVNVKPSFVETLSTVHRRSYCKFLESKP